MSDCKKTIHLQIDGHDAPGDIGRDANGAVDDLIRAFIKFAGTFEKKENDEKKDDEQSCENSRDGSSVSYQGQDVGCGSFSDCDTEDDLSAMDILHALHFLAKTMERDEEMKKMDEEDKEEKKLTRDQKNVLVGFDVARDSIMMFLANLDLYRDRIQEALVSYGYDAKDYGSVMNMIDKLFAHNSLSALATGEMDDGDEKECGSAFLVYKALRDSMMDYLENSRKHIVASFVEDCSSEENDNFKEEE